MSEPYGIVFPRNRKPVEKIEESIKQLEKIIIKKKLLVEMFKNMPEIEKALALINDVGI